MAYNAKNKSTNRFHVILGKIDTANTPLTAEEKEICDAACEALEKDDLDNARAQWSRLDKAEVVSVD